MSWYLKNVKLAFPYGKVVCPHCKCNFIADYGYNDPRNGGSSTINIDDTPSESVAFKNYKGSANLEESTNTIIKEIKNAVAQCPICHDWMLINYDYDAKRAKETEDFFEHTIAKKVNAITNDEARYLVESRKANQAFTVTI